MTMMTAIPLISFAVGGILALAGTYFVRSWSLRRGFVDHPGGHKGHARPIALGGGVAITMAVTIPIVAAIVAARLMSDHCPDWVPDQIRRHFAGIEAKSRLGIALAGSAGVMCAVGLLDDRKPLGPGIKFIIQCLIAAVLVIAFDLRLLSSVGYVPSTILSILWIVMLINSFNFLDNMDGLAAGMALIAASVFGATALQAGQVFVPACAFVLAGAMAGFLPFNMHPASIFMGDAGSLVIGLLLSVLTILTTFADPSHGQRPLGVIAPLVVMAVPLYDTASVMLLRWRLGQPLWKGDRRHFSHRLVRRGLPARIAVLVIWLATLVTSLPALLLPNAGWPLAWGILAQTILVVSLVALLESEPPRDPTT